MPAMNIENFLIDSNRSNLTIRKIELYRISTFFGWVGGIVSFDRDGKGLQKKTAEIMHSWLEVNNL